MKMLRQWISVVLWEKMVNQTRKVLIVPCFKRTWWTYYNLRGKTKINFVFVNRVFNWFLWCLFVSQFRLVDSEYLSLEPGFLLEGTNDILLGKLLLQMPIYFRLLSHWFLIEWKKKMWPNIHTWVDISFSEKNIHLAWFSL